MSLSINNSPFVKVDPSLMGRPASPSATGVTQTSAPSHLSVSRTPVRHDNIQVPPRHVELTSAAFAKLFDMLELVFKSMREMLAGKDITPEALPNAEKALTVRRDVAPQPPVRRDAAPQPALPGVTRPPVSVTNDANGQVKVEVNVNHCHCPDDKTEYDKRLRPRIAPGTDTAVSVQPKTIHAMPSVLLKQDTSPRSEVTPPPIPEVIPGDDTKPKVDLVLPKPLPDLTSPPPQTNRTDRNDQGFNRRTWIRS